jgi:tetratricopeptide (TPR) repeat protein
VKTWLRAAVFVAASTSTLGARADTPPSSWDFARDPGERARWRLHVAVERALNPVEPQDDENATPAIDPELARKRANEVGLARARADLEEADAAHSPDPQLVFDLGIVYERLDEYEAGHTLLERAIAVLGPALQANPTHPGAHEAFYALAISLAKLDRSREEIAAWRHVLSTTRDPRHRLVPMMNLGEAQMRVGDLDSALATFQDSLDLSGDLPNSSSLSQDFVLTTWDLAVALDRHGDAARALTEAGNARSFTWLERSRNAPPQVVTGWQMIQDYKNVFFVPEWDREWYLALGDAAAATEHANAGDSPKAVKLWRLSKGHWESYLDGAERSLAGQAPGADRVTEGFVAVARARLARVERALGLAERAAARQARPASPQRAESGAGVEPP